VKLSKALSWVLRHAAPSLGLKLGPDGYVPVRDVLALDHPRFRGGDGRPLYREEDVLRVVRDNDKRRFSVRGGATGDEGERDDGRDAHENENLDGVGEKAQAATAAPRGALCIRANQGHSLRGVRSDRLLTPLTGEELSSPDLTVVHGTTREAWEEHIREEGLSRMKRNHIHFATGLPPPRGNKKQKRDGGEAGDAPVSGMRSSSEVYVYVDGRKCAEDGVPFYRSDNGVILTGGAGEGGVLPVKYFRKVECAASGRVLWEPESG
ncbi:hypothetical protein ACHAWF_005274, partial [Thalassiosira exigua]